MARSGDRQVVVITGVEVDLDMCYDQTVPRWSSDGRMSLESVSAASPEVVQRGPSRELSGDDDE